MHYKDEKGAITVEATISLSAFMFAIVTILSVINICTVQAKIGVAINTTAKELSQYCYLYSLTGLSESEANLRENGISDTAELNSVVQNIGTVFDEIQNLGESPKYSDLDIQGALDIVESKIGSIENIKVAGSSLQDSLMVIAEDPKGLIMGIAKMAASDGLELAKSHLIAAPLSKGLCKKHLVNSSDGSVESYLKSLGIVPNAAGSYLGGLDFSESTIFPYGSNEITVSVNYKVKIIALLPIDFEYEFTQTAITNGWLCGDSSYKSAEDFVNSEESGNKNAEEIGELVANNSIWNTATVSERSSLIRNLAIKDLQAEGYEKTSGLTDVQLYNKAKNEFVMIASMNPLYSAPDAETLTVSDIDEAAVKEGIERLCGKIASTTDGRTEIKTKKQADGKTNTHDCTKASKKIILVIPEDEGLVGEVQAIINGVNTRGVTIELVPDYGKGANKVPGTNTDKGNGGE